jgi:mannosyltransferase
VATAATLVAAVLVCHDLGARSLWLDEAFSVEIAGGTWTHLIARVSQEANMSLYYALLHGWLAFGRDEATIRALSAVAVVAAVPLTYRVGSALVGVRAAAAGALLLATHPFVVRAGQDARSYGLAIVLVLIGALALVGGTTPRWRVWGGAVVAGVYTHVLTVASFAAQLLVARRRVPFPAIVAVLLMAMPMAWFAVAHVDTQVPWLGPPDRAQLAWVASRLTGDRGWIGVAVYAIALLLAIRRGGFGVRFLAGWLALPIAATLAVSLVKPVFLDRYQLVVVPALVLLAGAGLMRLRAGTCAVAVLVALQLVAAVRASQQPSIEDWRDAVAWVKSAQRPGDAVACWVDFTCVAVDYYLTRPPAGGPPIVPLADAVADLGPIVADHPRIWLFVSHVQVGQADRRATLERIESALASSGYALAETRELLGVVVRRYERASKRTAPSLRSTSTLQMPRMRPSASSSTWNVPRGGSPGMPVANSNAIAGRPFSMRSTERWPGARRACSFRKKRATFAAPITGRRAACTSPPPSLTATTSGASRPAIVAPSSAASASMKRSSAARVRSCSERVGGWRVRS